MGYDEEVRELETRGQAPLVRCAKKRCFCHFNYENTKKPKSQSKKDQQPKPTRPKSDKICLRFNDGGC